MPTKSAPTKPTWLRPKAEVLAVVKKQNKIFQEDWNKYLKENKPKPKPKAKIKLPEKAQKLYDAIVNQSNFGCQRENVLRVIGVATGYDLLGFFKANETQDNDADVVAYPGVEPVGACFVVLNEDNATMFAEGELGMVIGGDGFQVCVASDGAGGNGDGDGYYAKVYDVTYESIRPATAAEIELFVSLHYAVICKCLVDQRLLK